VLGGGEHDLVEWLGPRLPRGGELAAQERVGRLADADDGVAVGAEEHAVIVTLGRMRGKLRVLLSDGSGLTARQAATQLGVAGHEVHVVSPDPMCLARWTRHVRQVHRVPAYGLDPFGWFEATLGVLHGGGFDALLPTQEQAAVLSLDAHRVHELGVAMAVPPFDALRRVQDKLSAYRTLAELGLPQPATKVAEAVLGAERLPVYVKTPIGTATSGVRLVRDHAELARAAGELEPPLLLQEPVEGTLIMVQSVFELGRLIAIHANDRIRIGANGGASVKRSIATNAVEEDVARLGSALGWHGALSMDGVLTADGPAWIDVNPRLVEPGNAWRAGVDLVEALLEMKEQPRGRSGVETRQVLVGVLGATTRRAALRELRRSGDEELTPTRRDPLAGVPVVAVAAAMLVHPGLGRRVAGGAVANYALTPAAWEAIVSRD
jgi:glutathione synthase/RimK-type ligase-like ATP-grasp enzyme